MTKNHQFGWRTTLAFALFVVSIGWPVVIPILPLLGVSTTATAAFSGVMVVAAELMLIAGAAVAGKEGFAFIKATVFGFLRVYGPPREVSRTRYTIGLDHVCDADNLWLGVPLLRTLSSEL